MRTERLVIRPWRPEEAPRLFDMYSRLEVVRFLGSQPSPMTDRAEADAAVVRAEARCAHPPWGWWAVEVEATRQVAGTVALVRIPDDAKRRTEVAWHLHPDSWGSGYATEAAAAVVARAHDAGIPDVLALVDTANVASQRVAERLGLEPLGVSEEFYGKPLLVYAAAFWCSTRSRRRHCRSTHDPRSTD